MSITGETMSLAVIGDPIRHSLSPVIHNHWIETAGIDAVYGALHLQSDEAQLDIASLYRVGFKGLNVTLPYKVDALNAAISTSDHCRRIGAANTLVRSDEGWRAHNTDADGFMAALKAATADMSLTGAKVVIIGAGGAARAAVAALHEAGADLIIVNRTTSRARDLANDLAPSADIAGLDALDDALKDAKLVVNATSMGHGGQMLSLPQGEGRLLFDLSYGYAAESFLRSAEVSGWRTEDGLRMLVEQARAAFRLWFDIDPDPVEALQLCRKTLGAS